PSASATATPNRPSSASASKPSRTNCRCSSRSSATGSRTSWTSFLTVSTIIDCSSESSKSCICWDPEGQCERAGRSSASAGPVVQQSRAGRRGEQRREAVAGARRLRGHAEQRIEQGRPPALLDELRRVDLGQAVQRDDRLVGAADLVDETVLERLLRRVDPAVGELDDPRAGQL